MPLGRKGFYVSAPLLGTVMFLIAALLAVLITVEDETRIRTATSTAGQEKLQFIAQTIMADSYNVMLQENLERLTDEYLNEEYIDVSTGEGDWKTNMRGKLVEHYSKSLGEAMGLDVSAYAEAYSQLPSVLKCEVATVAGAYSKPTATDSPDGDGTIVVRGHSTGERINCTSREPTAEIAVDIIDRYYRINVRLPELYRIAKQVLGAAKGAMNTGSEGIDEPIAKWKGPRWAVIKTFDNTLSKPEEFDLLAGISFEWSELMTFVSNQIIFIEGGKISSSGAPEVKIREFNISEETGGQYELRDFEISCIPRDAGDSAEYRGCMPFKTVAYLGRSCADSGGDPIGGDEEFYSITGIAVRCGGRACKADFERILREIAAPVGKVCIRFYDPDAVLPVCKEWQAKAKAALMRGMLQDDNADYVLTGSTSTDFKFRDTQYNIDVSKIKEAKLECDEGDEDDESYRRNVRTLMASLHLRMGVGKVAGAANERWIGDKTFLEELKDENLYAMYEGTFTKSGMPMPCFYDGVTTQSGCLAVSEKPAISLKVDWSEAREGCKARADELCDALCGGEADDTYAETFCRNLFPASGPLGGKGALRCKGGSCGGDVEVRIDSMSLDH